jgi:transposase
MTRIEITMLVRCYHQLEQEIDSITQHLVELIKTSVGHEWLSTVPGLGDITIVDLLAGIGSFSHYEDPRQLLKLAGLT